MHTVHGGGGGWRRELRRKGKEGHEAQCSTVPHSTWLRLQKLPSSNIGNPQPLLHVLLTLGIREKRILISLFVGVSLHFLEQVLVFHSFLRMRLVLIGLVFTFCTLR